MSDSVSDSFIVCRVGAGPTVGSSHMLIRVLGEQRRCSGLGERDGRWMPARPTTPVVDCS